jgi:hypothetical protein
MNAKLNNCVLNEFILTNILFKTILFLVELSQNRKKANNSVPKLKGLGLSVVG